MIRRNVVKFLPLYNGREREKKWNSNGNEKRIR